MLASVVKYTEDAAGLEKTLRLLQALCTIASGLAIVEDPAKFVVARAQLNLGRRYFRLLKWYPCWGKALGSMNKGGTATLEMLLENGKWGFLGMYFFLEAFTIFEANRCWFFGLVFSVLLSLYELVFAGARPVPTRGPPAHSVDKPMEKGEDAAKAEEKKDPAPANQVMATNRRKICTQLAIDGFDLIIPGAAIGWIPVSVVVVGTATSISSILAGQQIWVRVQQEARK